MLDRSEEVRYDRCPVCSFAKVRRWRVKEVGDEAYPLDRCDSCGFAFVNPRPSLAFLSAFYAAVGHGNGAGAAREKADPRAVLARERAAPNSTIDARRMIETVGRLMGTADRGRLLDVGCGYGFFSREASAAGFEVVPLETAENEREVAREIAGVAPVACLFEDFDGAPASMSVVLMSQILEHARDVNVWMRKAGDLLIDGGILAIALPNFGSVFRLVLQEREAYICPPAHLNFFDAGSLSALLEKHGFRVERTQWVTRVPDSALKRRLPRALAPFLPIAAAASRGCSRLIDTARLGMMLNLYARKV